MSIKGRIWIFQLVAVAAVITMAAVAFLGVRASDQHLSRVQYSRQQLDGAMQLAIHANRFSEQIAELLLIGEPERPDFESARTQTSAILSQMRMAAIQEMHDLTDVAELAKEQRELDRLGRMRTLFVQIDRAVERVLLLDRQGREDEAIALFRSEIENRLDADFEKMIAATLEAERADVAAADLRAKELSQMLLIGTLLVLGVLVAAAIVSSVLFSRAVETPIKRLAEGALAVESGDLDHRIAYDKDDEFGLLARRFNAMVEEVQSQRRTLMAARTDLEREVAERTRELAEANRRLTELDGQRVKFLAEISHELKTPLTVLRGEAEVTLRGASKPEAAYREALVNIAGQAGDMGRLVDDLLFLARAEVGEVQFDFRPVPLSDLVSSAVRDASFLTRDRGLDIALGGATDSPIVLADPRRLKQALLIVLDNAAKYAKAQSDIGVAISAMNGQAQVSVHNDGAAIRPEDLPHVFERFYRAANASPAGRGGSGLGLAIARWIVEKHDGRIDLTSSPAAGTEVVIRLPRAGG